MRVNLRPSIPSKGFGPRPMMPKKRREEKIEEQIDATNQQYSDTRYNFPPGYEPGIPETPEHPSVPTPDYPSERLAEAYVVWQKYPDNLYTPQEALNKGTLFPELYRPYPPTHKS